DRRILHGYLSAAGVPDAAFAGVLAVVDKIDRQPRGVSEDKLEALGLDAKAMHAVMAIPEHTSLEAIQSLHVQGGEEIVAVFSRFASHVDALGGGAYLQPDLSIVRGLAYYTGIVFELFDAKGELRAICGGGRYDNLLRQSGGPDLPALGFGMGDVVLGELLRVRGQMPAAAPGVDVWVAFGDGATVDDAMRTASRLRARGRSVEYALGGQQLSRQLKAAGAAGAREAVILGAPNGAPGEATVRRLDDGDERRVRLDDWIDTTGSPGADGSPTHS
ncbi:MAG TPA: ATP phosphoribosyltransferase regulatory subunit, partial [Gemmatimonadaceae bacterium]|nr:ATP phosphoribosyltransferase regulatory subunit [Gemmatimonadaceae bacterium]